jgi:hypothetical protein
MQELELLHVLQVLIVEVVRAAVRKHARLHILQ